MNEEMMRFFGEVLVCKVSALIEMISGFWARAGVVTDMESYEN
jgi:hypothetical protein